MKSRTVADSSRGSGNASQAWTLSAPIWSTDELPRQDRFAHWREVRAKNLYGVTVELDKERHFDFHGAMSAARVGSATLVEMHASSYRVRRTDADIARAPSDSLCIYQQLDGQCWFDTGKAGAVCVAPRAPAA